MSKTPRILDSGNRRKFETGAVRDICEGKGRCDLLPLREVAEMFFTSKFEIARILDYLATFMVTGSFAEIHAALKLFLDMAYKNRSEAILELSIHFEEGAQKYAERNWEKGIPCHCYIDSGVRHLLKWYRGDKDERHDRAFLWNMVCLLWTVRNHPECNDLPFAASEDKDDE